MDILAYDDSASPKWKRSVAKVAVGAVALILLRLICTPPDAGAGAANAGSQKKFLALGTVQLSRFGCGTGGCDAPKGHCSCVEWDGPGQAQVSGLGTIKEVNVSFLTNLDSCVESPSLLFGNCCPATGILQFFKEPGPVAYNFNLLDATVCESPDEFSYKATYQTLPSDAGSPINNSGTVPTLGEFEGIAPVPPDGHIQFFMR